MKSRYGTAPEGRRGVRYARVETRFPPRSDQRLALHLLADIVAFAFLTVRDIPPRPTRYEIVRKNYCQHASQGKERGETECWVTPFNFRALEPRND